MKAAEDETANFLRERISTWESRIDELLATEARALEERPQRVRELLDRCETARIKVELVARASPARFSAAVTSCENAFAELQRAWDSVTLRIRAGRSAARSASSF